MLRTLALSLALALISGPLSAKPLEYYLPDGVEYDPAVPTPAEVIDHEVGEWHVTHDKLLNYMRVLARHSDRIELTETGRTHEGRPLVLLSISAPSNIARLEEIRRRHAALSDPRRAAEVSGDMPVVTWLGYSVHGNESSGANAALVMAYHLAAATDAWTTDMLEGSVVLLDPVLNPDGLNRFANWVNMHRGNMLVPDPQSRELNEPWPNGRTNHYWFDLNRDWLLLVHPESRARIAQYQRWLPNVLTDHHEMGTDTTYFFQPGVQSRVNPLIPQRNQALTFDIAQYHAEALEEIGQLYYTRERFDDFYLGKGSTYPDVHGTIGILFEQASSRGHLQESEHGELDFPYTIRNQVLTSFSTLRAAHAMRGDLLRFQREFREDAYQAGRRDNTRAWVFGDDGDPQRAHDFIGVLLQHGIEVHPLERAVTLGGHEYRPGHAWVVPTAQPQYTLARGIFETRTEFEDTTFYDVSTWTLPLAYGLPYAEMGRRFSERSIGGVLESVPEPGTGLLPRAEPDYAWIFDWSDLYAPSALYRLLDAGVVVRAASEPFSVRTIDGVRAFGRGAILVPAGTQELDVGHVRGLLEEEVSGIGIDVHTAVSGLAEDGVDLGSPSIVALEKPRVALVIGRGINTYDAGEVWHLLDRRFGLPVTLLDRGAFSRHDLSRYTHLVMVDGNYDDEMAGKVSDWVRDGGVLVASKRAARWAAEHDLAKTEFTDAAAVEEMEGRRDYADYRPDWELQLLRGAIFSTDLDTTHPLGWGVPRRSLPVFRNTSLFMQPAENRYLTVARYDDSPLLSGYISPENLERLGGSAAVIVQRTGQGTVVLTADNLNFRGYWLGTSRLFMNAIVFGGVVQRTGSAD